MGLGTVRRTALVTGAAGFLGSHLVDRLLAEGFEVVGLDNLMTGDLINLEAAARDPHFHFEVGDVREPLRVYAELVFNFACPASPIHYQHDPYATLTTSVMGAQRLVEMARGRHCTIVHSSTSEIYGDPTVHPQPESYWGNVNPIGERSCYDEGKRCAETMLHDARRRWRVDARIVRIFNTYGPRMAFDDGRVVSSFITQALRGQPLTVFGDGSQSRSFCYVDDLIEGILRVAHVPELDGPVNLGNPGEITIAELATLVLELTDSTLPIVRRGLPQDDPKKRKPDIKRAREILGFEPRIDVRDGLELTIANFRERLSAIDSQPRRGFQLTPVVAINRRASALGELAEALPWFTEKVAACGDAHRIGDRMNAAEKLIGVTEALQQLHGMLERIAADPRLNGHEPSAHSRSIDQQLAELVEQLMQAQDNLDTVRVADLLEHETPPLLSRCRALASA
jgi:UDP-glucuronate decarboxylase